MKVLVAKDDLVVREMAVAGLEDAEFDRKATAGYTKKIGPPHS
jgi:hypothetical protein